MPRSEEPLLRRPSSDLSNNDRETAEEDALLTGQRLSSPSTSRWRSWREAGVLAWAVLATIAVVVLAVLFNQSQGASGEQQSRRPLGKRNLIFMVSDGMGPTSLELTRSFRQAVHGLPYDDALVLDGYVIGQSRTRSSSSLITDSAAGATAFACGKKSYNGAISTLPDYSPCGTVLEAAKRAGYKTGLVVTTRITDATPACFAAHVHKREEEDRIAEQLLGDYPLGRTVDLILGAGRCHFLPNETQGSCRMDNKDMLERAKKSGYTYVGNRKDFDRLNLGKAVKLPLLGLFADQDIPYEIDRVLEDDVYPSLQEMAKTAMTALTEATRHSDKGFFLMIEGSRIDHAGHANDPAAQVHEVLAYDQAFASVLEFLDEDTTEGLLVATSDHETGGLATAKQLEPFSYPEYRWFPKVLGNVSHSASWLHHEFAHHLSSSEDVTARDATVFLHSAIPKHLGIHDATEAEIELLLQKPEFALWLFSDMLSRRAQTGWSTHGHSGADVNIYASDITAAKSLIGNHENTEIGEFLRDYLEVDLDAITDELKGKSATWDSRVEGDAGWMGKTPVEGERMDGGSHLERYKGDFKTHRRCDICDA